MYLSLLTLLTKASATEGTRFFSPSITLDQQSGTTFSNQHILLKGIICKSQKTLITFISQKRCYQTQTFLLLYTNPIYAYNIFTIAHVIPSINLFGNVDSVLQQLMRLCKVLISKYNFQISPPSGFHDAKRPILIESENLIKLFLMHFDLPTQFEPLRQIEITVQTEFIIEI